MPCKYGFSTCSFIGQVEFCNDCDGGNNYQMKQENRGGPGRGQGRKLGEPTTTLSFRVPVKLKSKLKKAINEVIFQVRLESKAT